MCKPCPCPGKWLPTTIVTLLQDCVNRCTCASCGFLCALMKPVIVVVSGQGRHRMLNVCMPVSSLLQELRDIYVVMATLTQEQVSHLKFKWQLQITVPQLHMYVHIYIALICMCHVSTSPCVYMSYNVLCQGVTVNRIERYIDGAGDYIHSGMRQAQVSTLYQRRNRRVSGCTLHTRVMHPRETLHAHANANACTSMYTWHTHVYVYIRLWIVGVQISRKNTPWIFGVG